MSPVEPLRSLIAVQKQSSTVADWRARLLRLAARLAWLFGGARGGGKSNKTRQPHAIINTIARRIIHAEISVMPCATGATHELWKTTLQPVNPWCLNWAQTLAHHFPSSKKFVEQPMTHDWRKSMQTQAPRIACQTYAAMGRPVRRTRGSTGHSWGCAREQQASGRLRAVPPLAPSPHPSLHSSSWRC